MASYVNLPEGIYNKNAQFLYSYSYMFCPTRPQAGSESNQPNQAFPSQHCAIRKPTTRPLVVNAETRKVSSGKV